MGSKRKNKGKANQKILESERAWRLQYQMCTDMAIDPVNSPRQLHGNFNSDRQYRFNI